MGRSVHSALSSRMAVCAPSHVTLSSYRRAHRRTVAFTRILLAIACVVTCSVQLKRNHQAPFIRLPSVHNYFHFLARVLCVSDALHMFAGFLLPPFAEQHPQVLRQNRRVTKDAGEGRQKELENFHGVLMDISEGKASPRVRAFIAHLLVCVVVPLCACVTFGAGVSAFSSQVEAYVRGAVSCSGSVEKAAIENSTAVFTKRVYR